MSVLKTSPIRSSIVLVIMIIEPSNLPQMLRNNVFTEINGIYCSEYRLNNIKFKFTNLDYSRVEMGPVTRCRRVKLWSSTANPPQRSKWAEIGSPLGKKCRYEMDIV